MELWRVGVVEREFAADFSGTTWHQPVLLLILLLKLLKLLEPEMIFCCCIRCCRRKEKFKLVTVQMVYQEMINFHRQRLLEHLVLSGLQKCHT